MMLAAIGGDEGDIRRSHRWIGWHQHGGEIVQLLGKRFAHAQAGG